METKEIIERLEDILNSKEDTSEANQAGNEKFDNKAIMNILYLILHFVLNILKTPFIIIAKFLKDELVDSIKNDAKIYALIMGIMGVLFVFFSVIWLFISVAVGFYFYDKGYSLLLSIIYSIGFQTICFLLIGLIALIVSRNLKSFKILKKIEKYK